MTPIMKYLERKDLLTDKVEVRHIQGTNVTYTLVDDLLYKMDARY